MGNARTSVASRHRAPDFFMSRSVESSAKVVRMLLLPALMRLARSPQLVGTCSTDRLASADRTCRGT
jgi:hypothetical protein